MDEKILSRRDFLRFGVLTAGGAALAACAPEAVKETVTVKETVIVEVEGTPEVTEVEKIVTATPPPKEPVEIVFGVPSANSQAEYEPVLNAFMEANPDIKVSTFLITFPQGGWGGWNEKLAVMLAGGEQLDTVRIAIEGVRMVVARNLVIPYDDLIAATPGWAEGLEDYSPHLAETCVFKGKTYCLPLSHMNIVMWLNTKRLAEEGLDMPPEDWTFDDFVEYAQALTRRNGDQTTHYGIQLNVNNPFGLCPWLFNNGLEGIMGGPAMDMPLVNDPKFVEVIQMFHDLIYKHQVAPRPDAELPGSFQQGNMAMGNWGRWAWRGFRQEEFTDCDIQYMPKGMRQCTEVGFPALPIFRASQYKEETWRVISFIFERENLKNLTTSTTFTGTPALRSLGYSPEFVDQGPADSGRKWYESIDRDDMPVIPVTAPPDFPEMSDILARHLSQILANEEDVEIGLAQCQKELEEMVARRPENWVEMF